MEVQTRGKNWSTNECRERKREREWGWSLAAGNSGDGSWPSAVTDGSYHYFSSAPMPRVLPSCSILHMFTLWILFSEQLSRVMNAAAERANAIPLDPSRQWVNKKPGQEPHLSRLSENSGDDIIVEQ